jgi:RNA polymerase sigma-70 factor (ECF subfamily)
VRRKTDRQPKLQSLEQLEAARPAGTVVELTDFRDPLAEVTDDSTRSAVRQVVNRLPSSYARILELRFGDDLTVPEIARVLQLSESAAESRLSRARQAFRESWSAPGAPGEVSAAPVARDIP